MKYFNKQQRRYILIGLLLSPFLMIGLYISDNKIIYGGVTGVIIDKNTKRPIEGAVVFVHWQSEIIKFERYPGPAVYVDETTTDKMGRYRFSNSPPIKTESSMNLRDFAPVIGVAKEGYGLYVDALNHSKKVTGIKRIKYIPNEDSLKIELTEAKIEDVLKGTQKSNTRSYLLNIENITNKHHCFSNNIHQTLNYIKSLVLQVDNSLHTTTGYSSIKTILLNNHCAANKNFNGVK